MSREIFFFKNNAENEAERLVSDLFLFFKKALHEMKTSVLQPNFNILRKPSTWHTMKTNFINLFIKRYAQF